LCNFVDELEIINDIKFTLKEIDVISALINGKSIKSIAALLNLSPKTVETHLRNIKQKLNCSSKETVIDFIEKSDKYLLFNKHYTNLLINAEFERLLNKIGKIGQEIAVKCSNVCNKVIQHLSICNIKINDNSNIIFNCNVRNYYLDFLDLIQKLKQDIKIDKQIEEFKKFYQEKTTNVVVVKDIKNNNIFTRKNKKYLMYVIAAVLAIISFFICINYENPIQIRMDIPKIHENVLLKRSQITRQIDKILDMQEGIKVTVLTGPGGAGKTTIAREYIISQGSNVVWEINAETKNSVLNSLEDLANNLAITNEQKEKLAFINSMKDYKEKNKKLLLFIARLLKKAKTWCLLFDNVDDFNMIKKYLPYNEKVWGKGKLFITTRNENIKNVNYLHKDYVVAITDLSIEESSKLCCDIMNVENEKSIQEFVKKLPPHPLDISAAAYYMKNTGTSFEDYLNETNNKDFSKTQRNIQRDSIGYEKTREAILKSNFDNICKQNPEFRELLLFICLLDSQNIPISYLKQLKDPITVDNFIYNLRKHSLIIPNKDNTFSIHRSTQTFGIRYVKEICTTKNVEVYLKEIIQSLKIDFNNIFQIKYEDGEKLIIHLETLLKKLKRLKLKGNATCMVPICIALNLLNEFYINNDRSILIKNYQDLINNCDFVINKADITQLLQHIAYITSYNDVNKSIEYCNFALKLCKLFSNNEYVMAKCYRTLGRNYFILGNIEEAQDYFKKSLNIIDKITNLNLKKDAKLSLYIELQAFYCNRYINKKEANKGIYFGDKVYSLMRNKIRNLEISSTDFSDLLCSMRDTIEIYLQLQMNKEANKNLKIMKNLIKETYSSNAYRQLKAKYYDSHKGYFLLNIGRILLAKKFFKKSYKYFKQANLIPNIKFCKTYYTQTLLMFEELQNAEIICKEILKDKSIDNRNLSKLMHCMNLYHMSIIKYKQKEYELSLKHFVEFFKHIKEFCKRFLDEPIYNSLEKENAFEIIKETKDIQKCLDNSLKIFTAIYGKDHSFVKDYVAENSKNRSWLYEHIKITGYYLQYYWDCFMKFLGFETF